MTHTATCTGPHNRRPFGLDRPVFIVRCPCGWRTETGDRHLASVISRNHNNRNGPTL
jgi:hypothetical protein